MLCGSSTYYKHFSAAPAPRTLENQKLRRMILEIYTGAKKRLSAAKIQIVLLRDYGIHISLGRVYRLMKEMQLPKMSTVKPKAPKAEDTQAPFTNYLEKKFSPPAPNQIWVSDITYIKIPGGFAFLCAIIELCSHKFIAFRVHDRTNATFVIQTLQDALDKRNPTDALLFHSDRGSQYSFNEFRRFCDEHNII